MFPGQIGSGSGDAAAYGLIVVQGYGAIGKQQVETPTLDTLWRNDKGRNLFVTARCGAEWHSGEEPQFERESSYVETFWPGESGGPTAMKVLVTGLVLCAAAFAQQENNRRCGREEGAFENVCSQCTTSLPLTTSRRSTHDEWMELVQAHGRERRQRQRRRVFRDRRLSDEELRTGEA